MITSYHVFRKAFTNYFKKKLKYFSSMPITITTKHENIN
jgi:hypothetical protein